MDNKFVNFLFVLIAGHTLMLNDCMSLASFEDTGPHGNGRYSKHMLPEVEMKDFRKGAQVSS